MLQPEKASPGHCPQIFRNRKADGLLCLSQIAERHPIPALHADVSVNDVTSLLAVFNSM